jgi:hypothetical protein
MIPTKAPIPSARNTREPPGTGRLPRLSLWEPRYEALSTKEKFRVREKRPADLRPPFVLVKMTANA